MYSGQRALIWACHPQKVQQAEEDLRLLTRSPLPGSQEHPCLLFPRRHFPLWGRQALVRSGQGSSPS